MSQVEMLAAVCALWFHDIWKGIAEKGSIYKCYKLLDQTDCICKGKSPGKLV
jgi:hypothetical protein